MNEKREFVSSLDQVLSTMIDFRKKFGNSQLLQVSCSQILISLVYGTLIINFFSNLTKKNVIINKLPRGKISIIKSRYSDIIRKSGAVIKRPHKLMERVDRDDYQHFRTDLLANYPNFGVILDEIEKKLDIRFLERYLDRSLKKIAISYNDDPETQVNTIIMEKYVENGRLPTNKKDFDLINKVIKKTIDESISLGVNFLNQNKLKTLEDIHRDKIEFELRLRKIWKEPLDLLELLINSSIELGENMKKQVSNGKVKITNPKHVALIKVHARAIQITNEILSLLESGYADGANGRWRTLYELTAIFLLLKDNADSLSEKYLEHQIVKAYKDANDYEDYHRKLGFRSIPKKTIQFIRNEYARLKITYGIDIKIDYGWIPKTILLDRNFKGLTKKVSIDHYLPFYNSSLNASHGGARGFYRMSLPKKSQNALLLSGPSIYGLADPIQNTAYCLRLMDTALLTLEKNLKNAIMSKMLMKYFDEIGKLAVKVHKEVESKMEP